MHCVNAPGLEDLAACAPDGGWGLTDPSRPGTLLRIATRPREAAAQQGAKLFAHLGPSEFVASASEGAGMPLALEVHGPTFWRMRVA